MPEPPDDHSEDDAPTAFARTSFAAFVHEQRGGLLHSELTDKLAEVVAGVVEHQKTGTLTLTVSVSPSKVTGAIEISDKATTKVPEPDRDSALFYADATGNISRRDPRQPELPFPRPVDSPRRTA